MFINVLPFCECVHVAIHAVKLPGVDGTWYRLLGGNGLHGLIADFWLLLPCFSVVGRRVLSL